MTDSRMQKQNEVEKIVKQIIDSDSDYIGMNFDTQRTRIEKLLDDLNKIFSDDNNFRPHYFFIFDFLDKKSWTELTSPLAFIKVIEEFLSKIDKSNLDKNCIAINKYLEDAVFNYNVNMFISAIKYELMVRKAISKSEEDIENHKNIIFDFANAPKETLNKQIKEYNSILEQYKKDFGGYLKKAKSELKEAKKKYKLSKNEIRKTKNDMSSLMTNVLTILGIFVSIIFIIVGAYFTVTGEIFNKSISNIVQVNLGRFILMGHVLINILFLFMFMISRLSGKNIYVRCQGCKDSQCISAKCGFFKRIVKKYPYVIYSNILILGSYIVLFGWWIIEHFAYKYIQDKFSDFVLAHPNLFIFIVFLIVAILVIIPIIILLLYSSKYKYIPNKNSKQCQEDN